MLSIGITAVGSGIGQPVLDSLRDSDLEAQIIGFEASPWAKGAYECDALYRLPFANDPSYSSEVLRLCEQAHLDLLIPGSDTELPALAQLAPTLRALGCQVIVSSVECIRVCRDKLVLYQEMTRAGVPFVTTWTLEAARAQAQSLPYPLIVKERGGSGSVGVQVLSCPADWDRVHCQGDWIVQPFLIPAAWYKGPEGVSPYLERLKHTGQPMQQDDLSIQVMVSETGQILGRFASVNRLKAGVPMCVDPIDDEMVWAATNSFADALIHLGLRGPCNLEGHITQQGVVFFEANPRFTGLSHVRAQMGYNEVEAAVRHFVLKQDDSVVKRHLTMLSDRVGLRQMTEIAVPRRRFEQFKTQGYLTRSAPFGRALVTGATGYLGYTLARTLLEKGVVERIVSPVRDPDEAREQWKEDPLRQRIQFMPWEMPDPIPGLDGVDLVIHAAAVRPPTLTAPEDWQNVNIMGTLALVKAVRQACVPYLIFVSSQTVYGTKQQPPWTEEHPVLPETPYAHSKATGEVLVQTLSYSGTRWAILRLARLYGLSQKTRWQELPHRFSSLAAEGGILPVHGDGRQRVDLLHVKDATSFIAQLLQCPPAAWNRVYNVGGGHPISVNDLAQQCIAISEAKRWAIPRIGYKENSTATWSCGMSIERAHNKVGWTPQISLAEGLSKLIAYARMKRGLVT